MPDEQHAAPPGLSRLEAAMYLAALEDLASGALAVESRSEADALVDALAELAKLRLTEQAVSLRHRIPDPDRSTADRLADLAERLDRKLDDVSTSGAVLADLAQAYVALARLERDTAPPPPPPQDDVPLHARRLLEAMRDAGISREHFHGRLEAMLRPLELLELELERTGR